MAQFSGLTLTTKGSALLAKVQIGSQLKFTRAAIGDGTLASGQSCATLTGLINQKQSLALNSIFLNNNKATLRIVINNIDLAAGYYIRELGVFATDPDQGEILYAVANAGSQADYLPAAGGADVIEYIWDVVLVVNNAADVTAVINDSNTYLTQLEYKGHKNAATLDHPDNSVTDAKIGNRTIDQAITTTASHAGSLTFLLSWFAKQIKTITGKPNWFDTPATIWRSDNDGSGSGLVADTVDDFHADALLRRLSIPSTNDLNDFLDLNAFFSYDTGTGSVKNSPKGDLAKGSGLVLVVENFGASQSRIFQRCIFLYPLNSLQMYIRNRADGTWGAWKEIATTDGNVATATNATNHITASSGAHNASAIACNATGDVSATNVQGAIAELANEKVSISDVVTDATANKLLKLNSGGVLPASITGNAPTATKLQNSRTISLTGAVTGNGSFDGGGDLSITTSANLLPAGMFSWFAMMTAPSGWLECNGNAVSRMTYAYLFAAIGTLYGAGDGSTTFNLPDLRGEFIRGWDHGKGLDSSRGFGSSQGDAIRNITGNFGAVARYGGTVAVSGPFALSNYPYDGSAGAGIPFYNAIFDASKTVPTAPENRPKNVALLPCIKY